MSYSHVSQKFEYSEQKIQEMKEKYPFLSIWGSIDMNMKDIGQLNERYNNENIDCQNYRGVNDGKIIEKETPKLERQDIEYLDPLVKSNVLTRDQFEWFLNLVDLMIDKKFVSLDDINRLFPDEVCQLQIKEIHPLCGHLKKWSRIAMEQSLNGIVVLLVDSATFHINNHNYILKKIKERRDSNLPLLDDAKRDLEKNYKKLENDIRLYEEVMSGKDLNKIFPEDDYDNLYCPNTRSALNMKTMVDALNIEVKKMMGDEPTQCSIDTLLKTSDIFNKASCHKDIENRGHCGKSINWTRCNVGERYSIGWIPWVTKILNGNGIKILSWYPLMNKDMKPLVDEKLIEGLTHEKLKWFCDFVNKLLFISSERNESYLPDAKSFLPQMCTFEEYKKNRNIKYPEFSLDEEQLYKLFIKYQNRIRDHSEILDTCLRLPLTEEKLYKLFNIEFMINTTECDVMGTKWTIVDMYPTLISETMRKWVTIQEKGENFYEVLSLLREICNHGPKQLVREKREQQEKK